MLFYYHVKGCKNAQSSDSQAGTGRYIGTGKDLHVFNVTKSFKSLIFIVFLFAVVKSRNDYLRET